MDPQEVVDKYKSYGIKLDELMVKKAIEFAIKYHGTQKRASGDPYYYHPLQVAEIIAEMRLDSDSIITAILHDTIEDTDLTFKEIERHFSPEIAKLVDGVTKLTKIEFKPDNVRQAENFRKLLFAMSDDIRVLLIKLADRLHNMRTIDFISKPEKRKLIALETMEIYAPLAERIGAQQLKIELQDICFRVLNPEVRESILNRFASIESDKGNFVEQIVAEIKKTVCADGTKAEVYGRRKTPYSTWMKMKQKDVGLDQLSDIVAFRVVVNTVEDCYRALGIVHAAYKMVPDNFQDFISTPKANGYQSLHTVVIGPFMDKIEIQIRTQEMHDIAELGVAAHWRYKQGHEDASEGRQYTWIRELLSILEQDSAPEEFLQNTKLAMYYDQVFCFTPRGSLIALPKGATTVDFAYMVHSDIGNSCVGAKVNGRIVPLRTQLVNGDQVEIITSKNQSASPSWEKFVVTGKARSEIRKITLSQQNEQYVKLGRNIITKALKVANIANETKALEKAAKVFDKTLEGLFFAIGGGTITREEVLKQVQPQKSRLSSTLSLLKFGRKKLTPEQKQENSVPIKGLISGMAMHYAKCCHPLPGDKIVGVVHTGSGVTIHTSDCEMLNNFAGMPERIIDLTWDSNASNIPFVCRISVVLLNEASGLAIISTEIARDGGNIINFKITSRNSDYFEMTFDIEVSSLDHIETIINSLRTKKVVQHVERTKY
ncbi:MAG: bifunctional (p)ppGpp synthetase/guanosine-3',5'-bis(diphosphate) 3'-pyrophosphohydrolase [Rickettsiaceae bacterium]|nr:bifunctional (p)ppGpp synthetase/guanosine-3',5'-bis(diphosphate) 3'-pyrophosphohydrolase [Rickettsiaceae bacterium]MDP5020515.1 bifunctional (p)ppGpp synthetase/guanosine-3',5'-bis(diphosphate) 3'-pyrophosphohydrolase [Rickettsiaceae bacterium]MDP5083645.1 bifunctional (p)ppGpp synthetase/guanosine-3',5'-bis(diphosphate) 3'-pyrophosphohydrolase [Rickettsiaceae bacterium]